MYRYLAILLASLTLASNNSEAGQADLSWTPPIQNTDGTPLTNLASYDIHSGCNSPGIYDRPIEVIPAPASSHAVLNLPDFGTCYFAVKAVNSSGALSAFSNEALKVMAAGAVPPDSDSINVTWAESQALIISNTQPGDYEWGVLADGELVYVDRGYVFTSIPSELVGLDYLRTANADKASTASNTVSFDVSRPVTVFVAHDIRITSKPDWLMAWTKTSMTVTTNDTSFDIYSKDFQAGTVILGGNDGKGKSMYSVMVK